MPFFEDEQGAAVLKHGILRCYLPVFVSKVGSQSPGGRVAYLDAYAGAGAYESGAAGSPVLAAEAAERLAEIRTLELFLVEKDPDTCERLGLNLAGMERCVIRCGKIEDHLDEFLDRAQGIPAFEFFDPFGLLVAMEDLARAFVRPWPTEMLLTFSLPGLRRSAGHLKPTTSTHEPYLKARETILARVNASLGGDWWQPIWEARGDDREHRIFVGYRERLVQAAGRPGWWSVAVSDRWGGPPVYVLLLLTRHPDGIWHFHECMSHARETYFQFTHRNEAPTLEDQLDYREAQWVDRIAINVERLLGEVGAFRTRDKLDQVFGEALGWGREKHVRRAVKRLYGEGKILWNGVTPTGQRFADQWITPVPG